MSRPFDRKSGSPRKRGNPAPVHVQERTRGREPHSASGTSSGVPLVSAESSFGIVIKNCHSEGPLIRLDGAGEYSIENSVGAGEVIESRYTERLPIPGGIATVVADGRTDQARITAEIADVPTKDDDEQRALDSLAAGWSAVHGIRCDVRHQSDSRYFEDGYLLPESTVEYEIAVQVTQLSADIRKSLGRDGYLDAYSTDALRDDLERALEHKAEFDKGARANAILALYVPVPIGNSVREAMLRVAISRKGYREVWLCIAGERAWKFLLKED